MDLSNSIINQIALITLCCSVITASGVILYEKTQLCSSLLMCRCPCALCVITEVTMNTTLRISIESLCLWHSEACNVTPGCAAPSWCFITITLGPAIKCDLKIHSKRSFSKLTQLRSLDTETLKLVKLDTCSSLC